jgi:O-antigen ligase
MTAMPEHSLEPAATMKASPLERLAGAVRLRGVADCLVVAVAVSLPWSTSATGILIVLWLVAALPTLDLALVRRELTTPAGGLPVLLWLLAAAGVLWADSSWSERFAGLGSFNKLLLVPLLLAQFRRSPHPERVILAFLASALVLLAASFGLAFIPGLTWRGKFNVGVPVKDYISQSGIFAMCALGLLGQAFVLWQARRRQFALALLLLAGLFVADIAYVVTSRTALVVMAAMLVLFGFWHSGWKGLIGAGVIGAVLAGLLWAAAPALRGRVTHLIQEVQDYRASGEETSAGLRIAFWQRSIEFVTQAPVVGHGTGTIKALFRDAVKGKPSADGFATTNPHSQILAVAIQLGLVGAVLLIAMWIAHLALFRDGSLMAWFGLVVVGSNVVSSLFNSHLFDFTQGWIYVFGLGVLGGAMLARASASTSEAEGL